MGFHLFIVVSRDGKYSIMRNMSVRWSLPQPGARQRHKKLWWSRFSNGLDRRTEQPLQSEDKVDSKTNLCQVQPSNVHSNKDDLWGKLHGG